MERVRPRVVIVGGGFGGLEAARGLASVAVDVVLVDRRNHHLFQPLLYQVATAALSPAEIASPIRGILRKQKNVQVVLGEAVEVETAARRLVLRDGERIAYDYLVLAAGAVDQYFGHDEWATFAPGLKSVEDAVEIRKRFLLAFEAAEREPDPTVRRALLTTVVIGGGPTGVEMAGAMAEMARHSLVRDFRRIDPATARILLLEGGERILPAYDSRLSRRAQRALVKRGVEVRTGSIVSRITADSVYVGEEPIPCRNVVWAAGVAAAALGRSLGAETDRMGRVRVRPDLSVPGHPEIFVIGDLAHFSTDGETALPGLAPVAMQQGRCAAANVLSRVQSAPAKPFAYLDKGSMATIGRGAAIAEFRGLKLSGTLAWLVWIFVHVYSLIGFRNRIAVMLEWAWAYLTWQRGARLITGPVEDVLRPAGLPPRIPDSQVNSARNDAPRRDGTAGPEPSAIPGWLEGDAEQAPRP